MAEAESEGASSHGFDLMPILVEVAEQAAPLVQAEIRDQISELYPPASEPDTPPHLRSGDLYASVEAVVIVGEGRVTVNCGSELEYAEYLENGTDRMAPRPIWHPTFVVWEDRIVDMLSDRLQQLVSGG